MSNRPTSDAASTSATQGADPQAAALYLQRGLLALEQGRERTGAAFLAKAVQAGPNRTARIRLISALAQIPWWIPAAPSYTASTAEHSLAWSPDGQRLLWAQGPGFTEDGANDWYVGTVVPGAALEVNRVLSALPSSHWVAFSTNPDFLIEYEWKGDPPARKIIATYRAADGSPATPSPSDREVFMPPSAETSVRDGAAIVERSDGIEVVLKLPRPFDSVHASADGSRAVTDYEIEVGGLVAVWSTDTMLPVLLKEYAWENREVAFSPGGGFVGIKQYLPPDWIGYWDLYDVTTSEPVRGTWESFRDPLDLMNVAFDPRGHYAAVGIRSREILVDEISDPLTGVEAWANLPPDPYEEAPDAEPPAGFSFERQQEGSLPTGAPILLRTPGGETTDLRALIGPGYVKQHPWSVGGDFMCLVTAFPQQTHVIDLQTLTVLDSFDEYESGREKALWLWELDEVLSDAQLLDVTKVLAGTEVAADGMVREIPRVERIELRRKVLAQTDPSWTGRIVRWMVSPRSERGDFPLEDRPASS